MEKRKRTEQKQKNAAWSKELNRKVEKERRREKKVKKREWMNSVEGAAIESKTDGKSSKDSSGDEDDDWDELAREERMAKKVKRGKLDANAFDAEFVEL